MLNTCSRVPPIATTTDSALETDLINYAQWLAQADSETRLIRQFRQTWPQRFVELCKFHLSVLIDMPLEILEECASHEPDYVQQLASPTGPGTVEHTVDIAAVPDSVYRACVKRPVRPWQRLRQIGSADTDFGRSAHGYRYSRNLPNGSVSKSAIGDQLYQNLMIMMDALDKPEHLSVEGIFRKTGNVVRQRLVRQRIMSDKVLNVDALINFTEPKPWRPAGRLGTQTHHRLPRRGQHSNQSDPSPASTQINVHDLASGLKGVLYELPEPVLSSRLLPLFAQVAALTAGRVDDRGNRIQLRPIEERLAAAKQLKAVRLLCLLLPEAHSRLFQRLLELLQHTLAYSSQNRMTAESLGTLFGPLLLSPGKIHTRDLHTQYNNLARLTTTMIEQGVNGLWQIPRSFAQDIERNHAHLLSALRVSQTIPAICVDNRTVQDDQRSGSEHLVRTASDDSGLGWTESSQPSSDVDSSVIPFPNQSQIDLPALVTCINFAVRSKLDPSSAAECQSLNGSNSSQSMLGETEFAVAELCATVQAMPDTDPRKRRLIQRFNATNGGLTPGSNDTGRRLATRQPWSKHKFGRTPSPSPTPFTRATTGNSAFKAAKTIRSSLRRRLAMKSTVSIASCFEHQNVHEKPIIERNEQTPVNEQDHPAPFADMDNLQSVASPIFDCSPLRPTDFDNFDSTYLSPMQCERTAFRMQPTQNPATRISLVSTTSITSLGANAGDLFFCCPLVEALASPFRRRVGTGSHQTPDSVRSHTTSTNTGTPMGRMARNVGKRFRCMSPPLTTGSDVSVRDDVATSQSGTNAQSYFPISFTKVLRPSEAQHSTQTQHTNTTTSQNPELNQRLKLPGLWRVTTQTNLLSYGYRTVSQLRRFRSFSTHAPPLQRSKTMPCVKSLVATSPKRNRIRPCESLALLSIQTHGSNKHMEHN